MNINESNPVILTDEEYQLLMPYAEKLPGKNEEMSLATELKRAIIVNKDAFPQHGIRLNSQVSVLDIDTQRVFEFMIVMPENADIKQNKISVLAPMGAALIGFRKSEEVKWRMPAGLKHFRIMDVTNQA